MNEIEKVNSVHTDIVGIICPQCGSNRYSKNGKENGSQRYKCKNCSKNFRSSTGSSIYRIHKKQLIQKYIYCINEGYTLRKAASEVGISLKTAFMWRHKLLSALAKNIEIPMNQYSVNATVILPYSEKGKRNKTKVDNENRPKPVINIIRTDGLGRYLISVLDTAHRFTDPVLKNITHRSSFLPEKSMPTIFKTVKNKPDGRIEQRVHSVKLELLQWIKKFRGVATKYLSHYWAWLMQLTQFDLMNDQQLMLFETCLTQNKVR